MKWLNHYHRWYSLLEVDPKKLLRMAANTQSDFKPDARKLSRLAENFKAGSIDAPIVGYGSKGISFVDGRHRTFLAAKMGLKNIKIAVLPQELSLIRKAIRGVGRTLQPKASV